MNYRLAGVLPVLAGLALALSVFACGGGDDSSTTPTPATTPTTTPTPMQEPAPTTQTRHEIINNAAANRPIAGSVSQGSRRGQTQQGLITPNAVTWNGSGGNAIRVTVGGVLAQPDPEDNTSSILEGVNSPDGVLDLVTDPSSGSTGSAIVQVVSDVSYTPSGEDTFTPSFSVNSADPNLVFGVWATEDADRNITAIGAFADGTETPSGEIPTSGTYTGNLFAFYQEFNGDGSIRKANYSVASVTLNVADNGSVSGTVSGIADKDGTDSESFTFIDLEGEPATIVTLAAAPPASADGGFFESTTSVSIGGQTPSSGTSTGRWGGQFFGDSGQNIAGTIGLNVSYESGGSFTVFGSFSAERN